jgi:hypothetical protein
MANPLSQLETLAEGLIEGTVARLLGARLQPVEVARYLARAMEDGRVVGARGQVVVPNAYWVRLHPDDMQALASYRDALQDELARTVASLARAAGAGMPGRPRVFLEASPAVPQRRVRVEARLVSAQHQGADMTHTPELDPAALGAQAPGPAAPAFALVDGYRRMPIGESVVTIGRSLDNDIVVDDERVSRRHAQLRRRYGQYVLYDLNSTGGTTVNGRPADETPLRHGDVLAFAGVKMRFEQLDAPPAPPDPPDATRPMPDPPRARGTSRPGGPARPGGTPPTGGRS